MKKQGLRWPLTITSLAVALIALSTSAGAGDDQDGEKGWLGVYLHDVDAETQEAWELPSTDGAIIDDVVEDSPAEKAGLKPGDVIVRFNDQPIASSDGISRLIRRAKPDTEIKLEIIRDKKPQTIAVVLGKAESDFEEHLDAGDVYVRDRRQRPLRVPVPGPLPHEYGFFAGEPTVRIGVQLHDLNRQLGEYFGVQGGRGVLVEEVAKESPAEKAGIKAGDVIVELGGHEVSDSRDVLNELRDYDPGDKVDLTVMRKGVRQALSVTLAEDDERSEGPVMLRKHGMTPGRLRTFTWESEEPKIKSETMDELRESMRELRKELEKAKEELWKALRELQEKTG